MNATRPSRLQLARDIFRDWRNRCRPHDWDYGARRTGGTGWGVVTCRRCGRWDLY